VHFAGPCVFDPVILVAAPADNEQSSGDRHMYDVDEFYIGDENPMYVQKWRSDVNGRRSPHVVLVHGGAHTGVCWTTCPDGRPGWAKLFADAGWTAYVIDWPGMGRSPRRPDFLTEGARPVIDGIAALLTKVGTSVAIGHSLGFPLLAKAIDISGDTVAALIAVAPAPPGNVHLDRPWAPTDRSRVVAPDYVARFFTNADRFPRYALEDYGRCLWDDSPALSNASADLDHSGALVIGHVDKLTGLPSLVLAAEQDTLTAPSRTSEVANFLKADHVVLGTDWGLTGFGHMMPIERGNELIVGRLLRWLEASDIHT
jgi:pimeloyl-ACP methyl ester carboxylesterase